MRSLLAPRSPARPAAFIQCHWHPVALSGAPRCHHAPPPRRTPALAEWPPHHRRTSSILR